MAKLRVGVIGAGMISRFHLIGWSRLSNVELCAICDPDLGRAEGRARAYSIPAFYASPAEMVVRENLDAVDIASPRECHAEHVLLAAERGLAALCQKPLTPTYEEAAALVHQVGGRCRLMVHENWRFRPHYRRLKQWIREGRLGALCSLRITVRSSGFLPDASGELPALVRQPFMRDVPRLAISETLIHHIDVARWLSGSLTLLAARTGRRCDQVVGEDKAFILMDGQSRSPVVVDGDLAAPGYPPRAIESCEVIGTRATALFQEGKLQLAGDPGSNEEFDAELSYQESFDACIRHFVECLSDGESFETSPEDNLRTLKLVEEAYASAKAPLDLTAMI